MEHSTYDLIVIGGGSGGVRAARYYASMGKKVALFEPHQIGGTCVHRGCVPKKLLHHAASHPHEKTLAQTFGWSETSETQFNWTFFQEKKRAHLQRLERIYFELLDKAGVVLYPEYATLKSPHEVLANGKSYSAKRILIATGGAPFIPNLHGKELLMDSSATLNLEKTPKSVVILGSGYIALELASLLQSFGASVSIFYHKENPFHRYDDDTAKLWKDSLEKQGIQFITHASLVKLERLQEESLKLTYTHGTTEKIMEVESVISALGRTAQTKNIGLENTKVILDKRGRVLTNGAFQTDEPSIYAIGDILSKNHGFDLTPVAIKQAMHAVDSFELEHAKDFSYHAIPSAVFTHPEMGFVGESEKEAKSRLGENGVKVYHTQFVPTFAAFQEHEKKERVFFKLVVSAFDETLLGAQALGSNASELIQTPALGILAGLKKQHLDQLIGVHPTSAEEWFTLKG